MYVVRGVQSVLVDNVLVVNANVVGLNTGSCAGGSSAREIPPVSQEDIHP